MLFESGRWQHGQHQGVGSRLLIVGLGAVVGLVATRGPQTSLLHVNTEDKSSLRSAGDVEETEGRRCGPGRFKIKRQQLI